MYEIVCNYFSKVFTEHERTVDMGNASSHRMISADQNLKLTEAFSFEEFTAALKQMNPDKA